MLIRTPAQNVESFLDAIARHLTSRGWRLDGTDGDGVAFGQSGWRGEFEHREIDGAKTPVGLRLVSDDGDIDDVDVDVIEEAIGLLEGLEYKETEPEAAEAEDAPPAAERPAPRRRIHSRPPRS